MIHEYWFRNRTERIPQLQEGVKIKETVTIFPVCVWGYFFTGRFLGRTMERTFARLLCPSRQICGRITTMPMSMYCERLHLDDHRICADHTT